MHNMSTVVYNSNLEDDSKDLYRLHNTSTGDPIPNFPETGREINDMDGEFHSTGSTGCSSHMSGRTLSVSSGSHQTYS